jgi:hypothetical protein
LTGAPRRRAIVAIAVAAVTIDSAGVLLVLTSRARPAEYA